MSISYTFSPKTAEKHAFYITLCHNVANRHMRKASEKRQVLTKNPFEEIDSLQASSPCRPWHGDTEYAYFSVLIIVTKIIGVKTMGFVSPISSSHRPPKSSSLIPELTASIF